MSDFQREERFIVIKRKHLNDEQETNLRMFMARNRIGTVECVVVESDWPEYETVWSMIEARCAGATPPPPSQHPEPIGADREAAARLINPNVEGIFKADDLRSGKWDSHPYVQAFMRHRLAFSTPAASEPD